METVTIEDSEDIDIICEAITRAYKETANEQKLEKVFKRRLKAIIKKLNEAVHCIPISKISFVRYDLNTPLNSHLEMVKNQQFVLDSEKVAKITEILQFLIKARQSLCENCESLEEFKMNYEEQEASSENDTVKRIESFIEVRGFIEKKMLAMKESIIKHKESIIENQEKPSDFSSIYDNFSAFF